jgi:hypothetical protein
VQDISPLGLEEPRGRELSYGLQEEIMDYAPWVLALNFKDIYVLNTKVDWESFSNERRDMYDVRGYLNVAWWTAAFPRLAIALVVLAASFMGDSLCDRLDPALRNNT